MSNIFIKGLYIKPKEDGSLDVTELGYEVNEDVIEEKPKPRGEEIKAELLKKLRQDVISSQGSVE